MKITKFLAEGSGTVTLNSISGKLSEFEISLIAMTAIILAILLIIGLTLLVIYIVNNIKRQNANIYRKMGKSTQLRLINQLREAVEVLAEHKTGAIITIENKDNLDNLRTDGVIIDANISSSLIISIFNKESPLHDGAIIIRDSKIVYASTFYKITRKSIDNKYGARHRAAIGISEVSDALTVVVSEETGAITLTMRSERTVVNIKEFQEKLIQYLNI